MRKIFEPYYMLLAYHWTQAAEAPDREKNELSLLKALGYLEKAGDQAMQNYANKEAVQFFTHALEWEQKLPKPENKEEMQERQFRRASWHSRIGLAHYGLGSLPDCEESDA